MSKKIILQRILIIFVFVALTITAALAQTTAFTYQGRLTDAGMPPTANYDFQLTLFDAGGVIIAAPQQRLNVPVTNGVFNLSLDFGAGAFPGANRFLEISVRPAGGGAFTTLAPRQPILSAPYSIKSLTAANADNAIQLGGVNSSLFVQQDAVGNVAIGGGLTVNGSLSLNTVNAQTQYNLGGSRILAANLGNSSISLGQNSGSTVSAFNTFLGAFAGQSNSTGVSNTFVGNAAGQANTSGASNSFFGASAGINNVSGSNNAFFGVFAGRVSTAASNNAFFGSFSGQNNTTGSGNSFFGYATGSNTTIGNFNAFFGAQTGFNNTTGKENSFFGDGAGAGNVSGNFNTFVGRQAGLNNTASNNSFFGQFTGQTNITGVNNTIIGAWADVGASNLTNATALGANAVVSQSNSLILGNNANVGIGTSTPNSKLTVTGLIQTTFGGVKFPDGTIQTTAAAGGSSVTSLNGLTGNITLAAGANITITPSGNTLTIASMGGGGGILNQTTLQTSANFNIDGTGSAGAFFTNFITANDFRTGSGDTSILNSAGGVLRVGLDAGTGAGGNQNTFVGNNSGDNAGTSDDNTFVGYQAGRLATSATGGNSFFGAFTGSGTQGGFNSFFGKSAGGKTTGGAGNVFVGWKAGFENATGNNNTVIGNNAGVPIGATNLSDATAIGANAIVSQSNSLVLGSINGLNGGVDTRIGIGTTAPKAKLDVTGGNILVGSPGQGIILKSPNGTTCRLLSIDNAGAMVLTTVACP